MNLTVLEQNTQTDNKPNHVFKDMEIEMTEKAFQKFVETSKSEDKDIVRIGVKGGGCSGFQYVLELIDDKDIDQEEDIQAFNNQYGIMFVMDVFSKQYLKGTIIDYKESLMETGFKFEGMKTTKTCGCRSKLLGVR